MKALVTRVILLAAVLTPLSVLAQSGIYIDLQPGWSDLSDMPSSRQIGAASLSKDRFPSFRGSIGYLHDFNRLFGFGFEIGRGIYSTYRYKTPNQITTKARFTTYEFMSLWELHLKHHYDLFAKVGGGRNYFNVNTTTFDNPGPATKIRPIVAIGTNYNFTRHFALTVSYLHAFGQSISNFDSKPWRVPSMNALLAGCRISF